MEIIVLEVPEAKENGEKAFFSSNLFEEGVKTKKATKPLFRIKLLLCICENGQNANMMNCGS